MHHFKKIADKAIEGHSDPLIAYAELRAYKTEIEEALKELEPVALEESAKYGKSFELHGIKFERRNGATRYDFMHIERWQHLNTQLKNFEKSSKQAWAASKQGAHYVDGNGEEVQCPRVMYNKDSLIVK